jgi:hypothetical protein
MSKCHTIRSITAGAVATATCVCISASWAAPSLATTDQGGGGPTAAGSDIDIGAVIARRKEDMARDFVRFARARERYAAESYQR